jgi:hypothetical protein
MRILFDHGTPAPLRHALAAHAVVTAYEMGWTNLDNGALLSAAEAEFDVLITTDQNLQYQQNLPRRTLAILVLSTTSWPRIQLQVTMVAAAVDRLRPGDFIELTIA